MPARGAPRKLLTTHIQHVFLVYRTYEKYTYILYTVGVRAPVFRVIKVFTSRVMTSSTSTVTPHAPYMHKVLYPRVIIRHRVPRIFLPSEKRAGGGRCRDNPDRTRARAPTCVSRHPPSTLITHHGEGTTHAIHLAAFHRIGASRMTSERRRARGARAAD